MALYKFLLAAMFTLTTLSSIAHTTPAKDAKIIMTRVLEPTRANATKEMLNVYGFIASNNDLSETMLRLGVADTPACASHMQKKDNISTAYVQMKSFMNPLYRAYSYEEVQGSQNQVLADVLTDTSLYLNSTVWRLHRELRINSFPIPTTPTSVPEAHLDQLSRAYLQQYAKQTITDDMVKIYRNYVILYTLKDVIQEVATKCLPKLI